MSQEKISGAQIAEVMRDAATALRKMAAERDASCARAEALTRRADVEKLAAEMHNKGLELDTDFVTLADRLEKEAAAGRLPVIQEAVEMVGPNMGHTVSISDETKVASGLSNFEQFIVGDVG